MTKTPDMCLDDLPPKTGAYLSAMPSIQKMEEPKKRDPVHDAEVAEGMGFAREMAMQSYRTAYSVPAKYYKY